MFLASGFLVGALGRTLRGGSKGSVWSTRKKASLACCVRGLRGISKASVTAQQATKTVRRRFRSQTDVETSQQARNHMHRRFTAVLEAKPASKRRSKQEILCTSPFHRRFRSQTAVETSQQAGNLMHRRFAAVLKAKPASKRRSKQEILCIAVSPPF